MGIRGLVAMPQSPQPPPSPPPAGKKTMLLTTTCAAIFCFHSIRDRCYQQVLHTMKTNFYHSQILWLSYLHGIYRKTSLRQDSQIPRASPFHPLPPCSGRRPPRGCHAVLLSWRRPRDHVGGTRGAARCSTTCPRVTPSGGGCDVGLEA